LDIQNLGLEMKLRTTIWGEGSVQFSRKVTVQEALRQCAGLYRLLHKAADEDPELELDGMDWMDYVGTGEDN
jgi:hypothetical protein